MFDWGVAIKFAATMVIKDLGRDVQQQRTKVHE